MTLNGRQLLDILSLFMKCTEGVADLTIARGGSIFLSANVPCVSSFRLFSASELSFHRSCSERRIFPQRSLKCVDSEQSLTSSILVFLFFWFAIYTTAFLFINIQSINQSINHAV